MTPFEQFATAVRAFCFWATSPVTGHDETPEIAHLLADLIATAFLLGPDEGEPHEDCGVPEETLAKVQVKANSLPIQYYSEIFNNLVVPPEDPVVGDVVDDLTDIFRDLAPGLRLLERGDASGAAGHWQFWFRHHWGEHATSALRALWAHHGRRESG